MCVSDSTDETLDSVLTCDELRDLKVLSRATRSGCHCHAILRCGKARTCAGGGRRAVPHTDYRYCHVSVLLYRFGLLHEYMVQECLKTRVTKLLWLTTAIPSRPAAKVHSIRIVDDGKLSKVAGRLVKSIAISNGTAMQASETAPTAAAVVSHRASPRCWQ